MTKRFLNLTEEGILKKGKATIPTNTSKSNKHATDTPKNYLTEKQQDINFEGFEPERLADK